MTNREEKLIKKIKENIDEWLDACRFERDVPTERVLKEIKRDNKKIVAKLNKCNCTGNDKCNYCN